MHSENGASTASFFGFHPLIARWFHSRFEAPTEPQRQGWPHIAAGEHTLIAAPTGSGKTLTAFLACIDRLLKQALEGPLEDTVRIVYVSPLRALSNDMHRNLEVPLQEILDLANGASAAPAERQPGETAVGNALCGVPPTPNSISPPGDSAVRHRGRSLHECSPREIERDANGAPNPPCPPLVRGGAGAPLIRVGLRTGDTSPSQRAALVRRPPHILVTTPESLYLMLTARKSRETLRNVETVIVDEIHALVRDKRGSHLALTLERLDALCQGRLQRIGLSATQKPIERMAAFLIGAGRAGGVSPPKDAGDEPAPLRIADCGLRIDGSPETESHSRPAASGIVPHAEKLVPRTLYRVPGTEYAERCTERQRPAAESREAAASVGPSLAPGEFDTAQSPQPSTHTPSNPQSAIRNPQFSLPCRVVNIGHGRELDLAVEVPPSELGAVCMHEQWDEVNRRIVELIAEHRSTLIFVNTRRLAERVTHQLTELLGEESVGSHHGSLSAPMRLKTERRLKSGELKAVVATASLELGIDIGYIDLVIQIGSPRSIATLLQRIGRSGHSLGLVPKGRLFALTRDELLESMALVRAVCGGRLDAVPIPEAPLDVLAQQIVAEVAAEEWSTDELFELCRWAWPYRGLSRRDFDRTIEYLSEGISKATGRSRVYLHHDQVQRRVRARKGARLAATTNAGAIPEIASYRVVAEPDATVVGSLDEDFAVESQRGDIFLLGNTSWRILHVRGGEVRVADAQGAPPTIPFWFGEGPGRTLELSEEVSRLREDLELRIADCGLRIEADEDPGRLVRPVNEIRELAATGFHSERPRPACPAGEGASAAAHPESDRTFFTGRTSRPGPQQGGASADLAGESRSPASKLAGVASEEGRLRPTQIDNPQSAIRNPQSNESAIVAWLADETRCSEFAARQAVEYVAAQKAAIGLVPTQKRVVFERFFDETGGMQLVVHAPFGGAINRAWGFAMRKRFCRSFDFELQATADDDGFILSLGPQHSFPIESLFPMLNERNVEPLLEQAVLAAPTFEVRWRWNVTRALLVLRQRNGKKVPPPIQRFRADDLLTAVFPRLTGCQEEHTGDIPLPDHPLVNQTMHDCLHEALDLNGLKRVLAGIERGEITLVARDTREPSPFCYELLNSNPYTFLDGGEIQERRTRAVSSRRTLTADDVRDLGRLDPEAIEQVREEAQPLIRSADELHDALLSRIVLPVDEFVGTVGDGKGEAPAEPPPSVEDSLRESPRDMGSESPTLHPARREPRPPAPDPRAAEWYRELADQKRAATIRLPDGRPAWVAAERLPAALAVFPEARPDPPIAAPDGVRRDWPSAEARVAMVRGLVEISGPITADEIAARLSITPDQAAAALEALEGEGVVLRGRFTPGERGASAPRLARTGVRLEQGAHAPRSPVQSRHMTDNEQPATAHLEWCHRRLLARIHRLTLQGLRRQIEPVGVDVFIRYLTQRHGLLPADRRTGANGLFEVVSMLQGIDVPVVCWERDLLPARIADYRPEHLDELCLSGEVGWGRLYPPRRDPDCGRPMAALTRVAPVSIFLRSDLDWLTAHRSPVECEALSSPAEQVFELLGRRGATFAGDLLSSAQMLAPHLEDALGELVSRGLVTADGFAGLRRLIAEKPSSSLRNARHRRRGVVRTRGTAAGAGRWSIWRDRATNEHYAAPPLNKGGPGGAESLPASRSAVSPPEERAAQRIESLDASAPPPAPPYQGGEQSDVVEHWAWQLLRRWGVVFRDLLARETGAPAWFSLLQVYRRLEARGEIRGGRFIKGVAGEQFALEETVSRLRRIRDDGPRRELVTISAADPLNLVGIVTDHSRVPSTASNRLAFLDGVPVAALAAGEITFSADLPPELRAVIAERWGLTPARQAPAALDAAPPDQPSGGGVGTERASADPAAPHRTRPRPPRGIPRPRI